MPESTTANLPTSLSLQAVDEFLEVVPSGEAAARPNVALDAQRALIGGLYSMGYTRKVISLIAKCSVPTVDRVLRKLRSDKTLKNGLDDVLARVENEALPLAMESLLHHLGKKDKEMTLETLKGRGVFKNYNNTRNEGAGTGGTSKPFQINIINQPQSAQIAVPADAIKGTPRQLGAPETVIDVET